MSSYTGVIKLWSGGCYAKNHRIRKIPEAFHRKGRVAQRSSPFRWTLTMCRKLDHAADQTSVERQEDTFLLSAFFYPSLLLQAHSCLQNPWVPHSCWMTAVLRHTTHSRSCNVVSHYKIHRQLLPNLAQGFPKDAVRRPLLWECSCTIFHLNFTTVCLCSNRTPRVKSGRETFQTYLRI